MALVCPSCGTENRLAAKFCIECVLPLPVDFAPTQQLPLRAGTAGPQSADDLPEALAAFAAGPVSTPSVPSGFTQFAAPVEPSRSKPPGKLRAFLVLSAGFALAAAAGWFVASSDEAAATASVSPVAEAPSTPALNTAPGAAASAASAPLPAVATEQAAQAAESTPEPTPAPTHAAAAPAPAQRPTPVAGANAPVAKAPPEAPKRVAAAPRPSQRAGLLASCEPMSFIARSRCKVEICTSRANRQHPECAPVLEQQRLVEEKRNPQMAY